MEPTPQIKASASAGILDTLYALGRYLGVMAAVLPILLTFWSTRDVLGLIVYLQSEDGVKLVAALGGFVTLGWGLVKTFRRGAQVASVAADPRVPEAVATLK